MASRGRNIFTEIFGLIIGGFIVLAAILFLRLTQGPASIDFLKPFIEAHLDAGGVRMDFQHVALGAEGWGKPIELRLRNATLRAADNDPAITLDDAALTLSFRALLKGRFRPIHITALHPKVILQRQQDGSFSFGLDDQPKQPATANGDTLKDLLAAQPGTLFGAWQEFEARDAEIILQDEHDQTILAADHVDMNVRHLKAGAAFSATGEMNGRTALTGEGELHTGAAGHLAFSISEIPGRAIGQLLNREPGGPVLDAPVSAKVDARFEGAKFSDISAEFTLGAGQFLDMAHLPAAIKINGGTVAMDYSLSPETFTLRNVNIALDGPTLVASGNALTDSSGKLTFDVSAGLDGLDVPKLGQFWPAGASPGAKAWVTQNILDGKVQQVKARVQGHGPRNDLPTIDIDSVDGSLILQNATVHYYGSLPNAEGVNGGATFTQEHFVAHITAGHSGGISIDDGTVTIDSFNNPVQPILMDIGLHGTIGSALALIDNPPLLYARKLKLDPASIGGDFSGVVHFDFPLAGDLGFKDVNIGVNATVKGASLPGIYQGHGMADVDGVLKMNAREFQLTGTGTLGDQPLSFDYRQLFGSDIQPATVIGFDGLISQKVRAEFGFDFPDRVAGPVQVAGQYKQFPAKSQMDVDVDLTPAIFRIDEIGYVKPQGRQGKAAMQLHLVKGALQSVDHIDVTAPRFSATGTATLNPEGKGLQSLKIERLRANDTDMTVAITIDANGDSHIAASGPSFDAQGLMHKTQSEAEASAPTAAATDSGDTKRIFLDISFDSIRTGAESSLQDFRGRLQLLGSRWLGASFVANTGGQGMSLDYMPETADPNGPYIFHAVALDGGSALSGFGLSDAIRGGSLRVDARKAALSGADPTPPLTGQMELNRFTVVKAPALVKLANLLSLQGMMETFSGRPIEFDSLTGRFSLSDHKAELRDGKLDGSALGLTIGGTIDRDQGTLDLTGVAVPANSVNKFLNHIPVLGHILTGGDGEGIFAATYTVRGTFEAPDVSINPVSIFTPGILRDLLFLRRLPKLPEAAPQ